MEPVGLAVGILALAGVFNDAVECFDYVRVARTAQRDLTTSQFLLEHQRLRLSRWGTALGLTIDPQMDSTLLPTDHPLKKSGMTEDDLNKLKAKLVHIQTLFQDAEKTAKKYKAAVPSGVLAPTSNAPSTPDKLARLQAKFEGMSFSRRSKPKAPRTAWALYERDEIEKLIDDLQKMIDALLESTPDFEGARSKIATQQIASMQEDLDSDSQLRLLQGLVRSNSDKDMSDAINQALSANVGHTTHTSGDSPATASTIPRSVNRRLYTGREDIALKLLEAFNRDQGPEDLESRVFVIVGMGGTGKSEVALKYAEDHRKTYWGRFWVDCSSSDVADRSFKRLSQLCGWPEHDLESIKSRLSSTTQRWLLILDNGDNPRLDLQEYIPPSFIGDIIVTTRNPDCKELATVGSEDLKGLEHELATQLLLKAASLSEGKRQEDIAMAEKIVSELDSHTLAIIQAGAYIKTSCTLESYLQLYKGQKDRFLRQKRSQGKSRYDSVFRTFEVSAEWMEDAEKEGATDAADALNLLHVVSFMHFRGISEPLFSEAADYASVLLISQASSSEREVSRPDNLDASQVPKFAPLPSLGALGRQRWSEACALLEKFSLVVIEYVGQHQNITVHPLVHEWAKERQNDDSRTKHWLQAASVLALACRSNVEYIPIFDQLRIHIRACLTHQMASYLQNVPGLQATSLLIQLAVVLQHTYSSEQTNEAFTIIESKIEGMSDYYKPLKARAWYYKGIYLLDVGRNAEAIELLKQVIEIDATLYDDEHPSRLSAQHRLACAYTANDQTDKSIALLEHVVSVESKLPETHPNRLASQHSLARAYNAAGQIKRAIELLQEVVRVEASHLDELHPRRIASHHELARALVADGQDVEALKLFKYVVEMESKLNWDHPDQLAAQSELAHAYRHSGHPEKAVELLETVVSVGGAAQDDGSLDRIKLQFELAKDYREIGETGKAVELMERVVHAEATKLAEDNSRRLTSQYELGRTYRHNGEFDKAVTVLEQVVHVEATKLDVNHRHQILAQDALAKAYQANGQMDKAIEMFEKIVRIYSTKPYDDPFRVASEEMLMSAYEANGEEEKSRSVILGSLRAGTKNTERHALENE